MPTTAPTSTPSPSVTPTLPLPPIGTDAPTQVPTATPTTVPTRASCDVPPAELATPPELSILEWETATINDQGLRRLTNPIQSIPLGITQDGRWVATVFQTGVGHAALGLIDTQANNHLWVGRDTYFDLTASFPFDWFERWLSKEKLVWQDGKERIIVRQGANQQIVEAPKPMIGTKYASNNIAFAQEEDTDLWRVDIESGRWEEVSPTDSNLGSYYSVARDGSYAFSFQGGQEGARMWRIPAEMGTAAEPLPDVEMPLNVVGSGQPHPLPRQLANTPYWLITLPILLEGTLADGISAGGIIVDIRDGSVLSATNLGASSAFYVTGFDLSPNGEWIEIVLGTYAGWFKV